MDLRVMTEPQQGATYDDLLAVARATEELGFDAFFRSDHYLAMGIPGRPGPSDAWVTLGALARETSRIRLGTLLTAATFRLPGPLAIAVAQVDAMSGGRVEFGLGAGWYEEEHAAYGIPFPPERERFERMREQLDVVTGLWETPEGETFTYAGTYYTVTDSPALPKPAQRPRPPVILGGTGPRRTPRLAAERADEYNVPFQPLDAVRERFAVARRACAELRRDPATLVLSNAQMLCCGRTDAELARRAERTRHDLGLLRDTQLAGTPNEIVDRLGAYADAGATRTYLQLLDLHDPEHLELVAAEVLPQLR
ncbi:MAG TPA: LLM class F420-dependent oxidoreductase [Frankiaceae bacterium]|nr:LLM class F420-dependent oxidoreductase [Frankiaceae bacterium]